MKLPLAAPYNSTMFNAALKVMEDPFAPRIYNFIKAQLFCHGQVNTGFFGKIKVKNERGNIILSI
jgi:hypothetical protein